MEALILDVSQKTALIKEIPIPQPSANEILIKVSHIALNPVDALYTAHPLATESQVSRVVGSDFAGTIAALGSSVSSLSSFRIGDRVAGFVQGACSVNERPGAFAAYCVSPWDLVWVVPDDLGLDSAAAVSLCGLTAAQALFERLDLPAPFATSSIVQSSSEVDALPLKIFIYGASTSLALYAAQLTQRSAKASGREIKIFGAASKGKHESLKAEPYQHTGLVDYRDEHWPEQVQKLAGGPVDLVFDCISERDSVPKSASTLVENGRIAVIRSRAGKAWDTPRELLPSEPLYGAVWSGLGEEVQYQGFTVAKSEKSREFAVDFYKYLSKEPLVPNSIRRMPGRLSKVVEDGFVLLGSGTVGGRVSDRVEEWMRPISGEKLSYNVGGDQA